MDQTAQTTSAQPDQVDQTATAKQQVVESLKNAKNVLVTLSTNPSVDELASALGLTALLAKLDKHVTAVFSGDVPPAMEFLDPEKVFENTVDSLRDFIIALDKEKADKLRYKVEDDVVKIFITPYKTTLKKEDFQFSQGDFNVDVVVALGVQKRDDLDRAITAHGRILHDATVLTINTTATSGLGAVDWTDAGASSIAEMLMSITESFGGGLLDEQISTAFLTGIVAATNRFSNEKTSPKVMTMSAQLMASGANQQLIATNLRREGMISESVRSKSDAATAHNDDGELTLEHEADKKPKQSDQAGDKKQQNQQPSKKQLGKKPSEAAKPAGEVSKPEPVEPASPEQPAVEIPLTPQGPALPELPKLDVTPAPVVSAPVQPVGDAPLPDLQQILAQTSNADDTDSTDQPAADPAAQDHKVIQPSPSADDQVAAVVTQQDDREETDKPMFGGTLNATTAEAEHQREAQLERESSENQTALSHDVTPPADMPAVDDSVEAARRAVEEAAGAAPFNPANQPLESIGAQPLPALPSDPALTPVDPTILNRQISGSSEQAAAAEEPDPMQAFMTPHVDSPAVPTDVSVPPSPFATDTSLPPLPPLPGTPAGPAMGDLPPLPPLPAASVDPSATFQPQVSPEFMQNMPQSQNSWTEAGEDVAAKQAEKDAARQEKIDAKGADYDAAVDQNLKLQGKAPINDDHSTFPLPPTS